MEGRMVAEGAGVKPNQGHSWPSQAPRLAPVHLPEPQLEARLLAPEYDDHRSPDQLRR